MRRIWRWLAWYILGPGLFGVPRPYNPGSFFDDLRRVMTGKKEWNLQHEQQQLATRSNEEEVRAD